MAATLLPYPKFKAVDTNGVPLSGGKVYTYVSGTTTNLTTYSNKSLSSANTNPVILDSNGEATIYLNGTYTIALYTALNVLVWTMDNIEGLGGEIIPSGTSMLFYEDTAPSGWTIQNTLDDKLVYITKGSVLAGQVGGAVHSSGSWTISGITELPHTHTGTSHSHHILTHTHTYSTHTHNIAALAHTAGGVGGTGWYATPDYAITTHAATTTAAGGDGVTDGVVLDTELTEPTLASTAPTISSDALWRPSCYCCIICERD